MEFLKTLNLFLQPITVILLLCIIVKLNKGNNLIFFDKLKFYFKRRFNQMNKINLKIIIISGILLSLPFLLKLNLSNNNIIYFFWNYYYNFVDTYFGRLDFKEGLTLYYTVIGIVVNVMVLWFYWQAHYDVNVKPKLTIKKFIEVSFIFNEDDVKRHKYLHQTLIENISHGKDFKYNNWKKRGSMFFSEVFSKQMLCELCAKSETYTYLTLIEELVYLNDNYSEIISLSKNSDFMKSFNDFLKKIVLILMF